MDKLTPDEITGRINQFFGQFSGLSDLQWEEVLKEVHRRATEAINATSKVPPRPETHK
jgi:hypothetical protein